MKLWLPVYLPGQLDEWHEEEARGKEGGRVEGRGSEGGRVVGRGEEEKVKEKEEQSAIDVNLSGRSETRTPRKLVSEYRSDLILIGRAEKQQCSILGTLWWGGI